MTALLFYASGHWLISAYGPTGLQGYLMEHRKILVPLALGLLAVLFYSSVWNGYVSIGSNKLGNNTLLFYGNGFLGTVLMLAVCIWYEAQKPFKGFSDRLYRFFLWFGQNSFYVMATHFPVKEIISRLVNGYFHCDVHKDIDYALLAFAITLVIDIVIVWGVCEIKRKMTKTSR